MDEDLNNPPEEDLNSLLAGADPATKDSLRAALYEQAPGEALVRRGPAERQRDSRVAGLLRGVKNVGKAAARGVNNGINETAKSLAGGISWAHEKVGAGDTASGKDIARIHREGLTLSRMVDAKLGPDEATGLSAFVRDASQFAVAWRQFGFIGKANAGAKVKAAVGAVRGMAADALGFDPRQDRLSNLALEGPEWIAKPAEMLAANPDDPEALARFKAAAEGLLLGGTIEAVVAGARRASGAREWWAKVQGARGTPKAVKVPSSPATAAPLNAPLEDAFDLVDTDAGEVRIVPKGAAAEELPVAVEELPVFTSRAEAEPVAASLNYAVRNARRPVEVTPEQTTLIRSLAGMLKDTDKFDMVQMGGVDVEGNAIGGFRDLNFRYDLSSEEVQSTLSSISMVLRDEFDAARATGGIDNATTVADAKAVLDGKTPDEFLSGAERDVQGVENGRFLWVAARMLRANLGEQATQLARQMEAPDNMVAHAEFVKSMNALVNTFIVESRLGTAFGRGLQTGKIKVGELDLAELAKQDGTPLEVVNFQLLDEPLDEAGVKALDGEADAAAPDGAPAADPAPKPEKPAGEPKEPKAKGPRQHVKTVHLTPRQARALARQMLYFPANEKERADVLRALLGTAKKATKDSDEAGPALWDRVVSYRRWSMLSALTSANVNAISAMATAWVRPVEGMLGAAARFDAEGMRQQADLLKGMYIGIKDAWGVTTRAFREGHEVLERQPTETFTFRNIDQRDPVSMLINAARISERLMMAGDEFAKQISYRGHAYAQSMAHARAAGVVDEAVLAQRVADDMERAFGEQGQGINPSALSYAQDVALRRPLEYGVGGMLEKSVREYPFMQLLLPFVRVPANIVRYNMDRFPILGALSRRNRTDWVAGGSQRDAVIARQAMGATFYTGAALLVNAGVITGGGPRDPELRQRWLAVYEPYSVRIGDQWVSYRRLEPVLTPLALVADFMEAAGELGDEEASAAMWQIIGATAENLMSKTHLRGVSDFFNAVSSGEAWQWERFSANLLGSFVPNALTRGNLDDTMREARGFVDQLRSRVPGLSDGLEPRRNIYGEKVMKTAGYFQRVFNPFTVAGAEADEVDMELLRMGLDMQLPPETKMGIDLTDRDRYRLPNRQSPYDRWLALMAEPYEDLPPLREALRELVQSAGYRNATEGTIEYPGGQKVLMIEGTVQQYRQLAFARLIKEHPSVMAEIYREAGRRGASLMDDPEISAGMNAAAVEIMRELGM
jgi:hypothetical protein